ncbi:MAG: ATP phosphoribosyltransferase [Gammaproteobacteria bacterium]
MNYSTDSDQITLAIGRGRALDNASPMLEKLGFKIPKTSSTRALGFDIGQGVSLQVQRNWDVPTYVHEGAADLGIVGNDIIAEQPDIQVYMPLDLRISVCKLCIAAPAGTQLPEYPRIATRHTVATKRWFQAQGQSMQVIPLQGSLESAPALGLADGICDLVETGRSLKENNLELIHTILSVSARLIINKASARWRMRAIDRLIQRFADS